MAKKTLKQLEKAYEVEDFYGYIVENLECGNFSSTPELLREMRRRDRAVFLMCVASGVYGEHMSHKQYLLTCIIDSLA